MGGRKYRLQYERASPCYTQDTNATIETIHDTRNAIINAWQDNDNVLAHTIYTVAVYS